MVLKRKVSRELTQFKLNRGKQFDPNITLLVVKSIILNFSILSVRLVLFWWLQKKRHTNDKKDLFDFFENFYQTLTQKKFMDVKEL